LQQAQAISYASTLHLLQAIVQQISDLNYPHLYLLTRGSQKVTKELSQGQPLQSALWALGRIVRLEHPELRCICLDLPPITHLEQDIKTLLTELFFPSPENQLCYREGVRYVARLKRYIPTEQTTFTVQNNSTYLITGGLGALGLQSARWLVEKGATYLVLLGRSQPSAAAQEVITQLENEGIHIEIAATDISDIVSVTNLFEFLHKSLPPLRGVIHAAGVIDDGVISQQSWERFTSVLNPKIAGTWNLHCLTKNLPLDFFVCFSSMTSLIGNPGQASYAVANAFMDALANYRQADNLPGLSINWGPWEEIGMATHLKNASQRRMLAHGVSSISLDTGLKLLEELLKQDVYQIGVLPINWSQFFEQSLHHQDQLFLEAFVPTLEPENVETFDFFQQLKTAPIHEKRALLTEHIRNQVGKIIALEPSEIHPQQGFFELGMDSLTSMELKKSLEKSLGYDVPDTFIFNYPTIEAVVDYIAQQSIETETSAVAPKSTVIDDNMPLEGLEDLESLSEAEISELLTQKLDALD
ncbi:beta-ketoacyl reductase, partial [Crocosphaera sp.]